MHSPSKNLITLQIFHENMMSRALELANQARMTAPPNPWVGCVIVKNDTIIGEGFTQPAGKAHAEIIALEQAKNQAKGAKAYVTLEPCAHFGRTPPCVNALIAAGISEVIIGVQDPDERVRGKGIQILRSAGIIVTEGVLSKKISESLASYLWHRKTGTPFCLLKGAISLDGRIAAADGTSQWISSPEALTDSQQLRAESQAILIGAGTACIDLPKLTLRDAKYSSAPAPLRVILDSRGKVPCVGPLFDISLAPTLIITSPLCPKDIRNSWEATGAQVEIISSAKNGIGVDLNQAMHLLGARGILQVLVEGGSKILGAFLEEKIFNHLTIYVGARVIGNKGLPLFTLTNMKTLKDSPMLNLLTIRVLGNSVRIDYAPLQD